MIFVSIFPVLLNINFQLLNLKDEANVNIKWNAGLTPLPLLTFELKASIWKIKYRAFLVGHTGLTGLSAITLIIINISNTVVPWWYHGGGQ